MILRGISKRYAVALFNAAVRQDIAEQIQEDLASIDELMKVNPEFKKFWKKFSGGFDKAGKV